MYQTFSPTEMIIIKSCNLYRNKFVHISFIYKGTMWKQILAGYDLKTKSKSLITIDEELGPINNRILHM